MSSPDPLPPRRVLRVFPDWGHPWPLWENCTEKYAMEPADYGLSTELTEMMQRWYRFWEEHFDPFGGWDAPENEQISQHRGDEMVARLRSETASFAEVRDEREL